MRPAEGEASEVRPAEGEATGKRPPENEAHLSMRPNTMIIQKMNTFESVRCSKNDV